MKNIDSLIRPNLTYFTGVVLFLMASFVLLLLDGKAMSFINLNTYHPFWLNVFFINFTFLGDGIFALCLVAAYFFYWKKRKEAIALLSAFLLSGIVVQVIKNLVSAQRPRLFFEAGRYPYFLDHVSLANFSSFPSGHTTTAFAIATVLILVLKNKKWQLPILFTTILVGYSRIYLAQHFLLDILIGAIIGSLSGFTAVYGVTYFKKIRFAFNRLHTVDNRREPVQSPGAIQPV